MAKLVIIIRWKEDSAHSLKYDFPLYLRQRVCVCVALVAGVELDAGVLKR